MATIFVTTWANIQWLRFMRFWLKPPYKSLTKILFRVFFAAGLLGALWNLAQQVRFHTDARFSYLSG